MLFDCSKATIHFFSLNFCTSSKLKSKYKLTLFHLVTFLKRMELEVVLASVDVLQIPFAMAAADIQRVNLVAELDRVGMHLVILAERSANMDAGSLDSKLAVLASFYLLKRQKKNDTK